MPATHGQAVLRTVARPGALMIWVTLARDSLPRATYYRHLEAKAPPPRPTPTRALTDAERRAVLDVLHEPRLADQAPAEVYARLGEHVNSRRARARGRPR